MKHKKSIKTFIALFEALLLGVFGVFAWIEGNTNPSISSSNMQLASSPGLIMKVNGSYTNSINLNKYCSDSSSKTLTLSEASSCDGKTIFMRKISDTEASSKEEDKIYVRRATESDKNATYLYVVFTLTADQAGQKVYLDPKASHVLYTNADNNQLPLEAVRVSFEIQKTDSKGNIDSSAEATTIIFSDYSSDDDADTNPKYGIYDFDVTSSLAQLDSLPNNYTHKVTVKNLDKCSVDDPLLTIQQNETYRVIMRVYLEGTDKTCIDSIAGDDLDFYLLFACEEISN